MFILHGGERQTNLSNNKYHSKKGVTKNLCTFLRVVSKKDAKIRYRQNRPDSYRRQDSGPFCRLGIKNYPSDKIYAANSFI